MMSLSSFHYRSSILSYTKTGSGSNVIFLFHGFGQTHKAFEPLLPTLDTTFTVYNFDLYFHGQSQWMEGEKPIEKQYWTELIQAFMAEQGIDRYSVCGFSLGCRFVMPLVEVMSDRLDHIYLLAPDGVKRSFWYSIATYPYVFRMVFKSMILHPALFRMIINALMELRLMPKGLLKFAEHQMNTVDKRKKVYLSWVVTRRLFCNLSGFAEIVNAHHIPLLVVVGKNDPVIPAGSVSNFMKKLEKGRLETLNIGHAGLLKDPGLLPLFGKAS